MTWNPKWQEERAELRQKTATAFASLERWFVRQRADALHVVTPSGFTIADVYLAVLLELSMALHPGLLQDYAQLHAFCLHFFTCPGPVRDYVHSTRRAPNHTIPIAPFGGKAAESYQGGK